MRCVAVLFAAVAASLAMPAQAQLYTPGTFRIDGIAVSCGNIPIILDTKLTDVGMSGHGLIFLNPNYLKDLKPGLRHWWVGHECAHHFVGPDEMAADCWSVRKGRDQGWFPPEMFRWMDLMFEHNLGDAEHPSGPDRVRHMLACYQT